MESKKIIFIGKPNAGKGTLQKEVLKGREDDFELLSVGDLLRKARKEHTELGEKAAPYMDAGKLVPDDIICEIAIEGLKSATKPIISDGFPRSIPQAQALLNAGISPIVIEFFVNDNIVHERARNRNVCENCGEIYTSNNFKKPKVEGFCDKCGGQLIKRKDDQPEIVAKRLLEYKEKTQPVINFFISNGIDIHTIYTYSDDAADQLKKLLGI